MPMLIKLFLEEILRHLGATTAAINGTDYGPTGDNCAEEGGSNDVARFIESLCDPSKRDVNLTKERSFIGLRTVGFDDNPVLKVLIYSLLVHGIGATVAQGDIQQSDIVINMIASVMKMNDEDAKQVEQCCLVNKIKCSGTIGAATNRRHGYDPWWGFANAMIPRDIEVALSDPPALMNSYAVHSNLLSFVMGATETLFGSRHVGELVSTIMKYDPVYLMSDTLIHEDTKWIQNNYVSVDLLQTFGRLMDIQNRSIGIRATEDVNQSSVVTPLMNVDEACVPHADKVKQSIEDDPVPDDDIKSPWPTTAIDFSSCVDSGDYVDRASDDNGDDKVR